MAGEGPPGDSRARDARTLAVVVSDIVGSTALRTRMGELAFTNLREAHDALAADLVEACGGRVVRFTGDGLLTAFGSASHALEYASMLLPGVERLGDDDARLVVRAGIALGDAIDVAGDLDGPALVEASRLCDAAAPGQVLCTELVRRASRADDTAFGDALVMQLKGLGDVDVRELLPRVTDRVATGLTITVLGQLRALRAGRPLDIGGTKEQRVLAVLAAARGDVVLVDELVEALWTTSPPRTAERSVHAYVARLRKAVEPSRDRGAPPRVIVTEGKGYRLTLDDDVLDSVRFERLTSFARDSIATGHALRGRHALDDALALWRGTPFQDHHDAERCARESRRLEHLHELAIEDLTSARLDLGHAADIVPELEALVALHPLREQLWANLMVALYRSGRQAEALRAFQRARAALIDELGIEPGPELHHLESRILAQDPGLLFAAPGASSPSRRIPAELEYGGTRLVGREAELAQLRAAWERAFAGTGEFVAIVGREGIGKTRLVSELAVQASEAGAIVMYARCDAADQDPEAPLDRALRGAGAQITDVAREPGETQGAAIARFLSMWSGGRPVLLVLDDFQLADTATVEALADLAEWSVSAALLVVAMFRPEDGEVGDTGRGRIALGALPRDAVVEIARGYRARWSDTEMDDLVAASEGVPLAAHRYASEWAQDATRREVRAAAERASEARVRLVASRGELADGIEGLQRLIEHRQLQLASRSSTPEGLRVPYRGLEAFSGVDADLYFGREELVAELVTRVASAPLVVVVGASGSGKSSLISAGLLPALDTGVVWDIGAWSATTTVPGREPRVALERMRRESSTSDHRVVVVDQLEELWTSSSDPDVHQEFCDHLVTLSRDDHVTLVLCIRADFVDRIADHAELAALVGANTLLVPPMTTDELRTVVEGPARRTGLQVEPQLVEAVVAEVHGRPGALPLLSMALLATWERREARTMTLAGYRAAGGVASAVAAAAEGCFGALTPGAQRAARRLLLQLAGEEHGVDVRRRVPLAAIATDDADTRQALDALVTRRLVIVDGDVAEVAHEALFRDWPRLAAWLDEDRSGRQLRQRLAAAAIAWVEGGRDESELYRGTRLDAAVESAEGHGDDLAPLEREFLAASRDAATRELRDAQQRARLETRRSRRLRITLGGIAALLVVALVAGGLALRANEDADRSALRADANRLAGLASSEPLLKNAVLDAVEGVRLHDSAETRAGLADALQRTPRALRIEQLEARGGMTLSPSAGVIAIQSFEPRDRFYDAESLALVGSLPSDAAIALLSDARAATIRFTETDASNQPPRYEIVVRSLEDPGEKERYVGGSGSVTGLVGSLESRLVLAVGLRADATTNTVEWYVDAWSLDDPGAPPIARYAEPVPQGPLWGRSTSIALSPDGNTAYVSRDSSPTVVLDARTLEPRATLPGVVGFDGAALSGDGGRLAVGKGTSIDVLDTATGERVTTVSQPSSSKLIEYALDATGSRLAIGDSAGSITIWTIDEVPSRALELSGPRDQVGGVFSPDGRDLWSFGLDGSLVRWDVEGSRGILRLVLPRSNDDLGALRGAAVSPDGLLQLAAFTHGSVLRDLRTGVVEPFDLDEPEELGPVGFSPDNSSLYGVGASGALYRYDVATRKLVTTGTRGVVGPVREMVVGRRVVALLTSEGISRFDATTLAPIDPVDLDMTGVGGSALALAPDGRSLALLRHRLPLATDAQLAFTQGVGQDSVVFVDLAKGRQTSEVPLAEHVTSFEYGPDGSLAVGTTSGRVLLLDPRMKSVTRRSAPNVADGFVGDMLFTDFGLAVSRRNGFVILLDRATLRYAGTPVQESAPGGGSQLAVRGRHDLLITYPSTGLVTSYDLRPSALLAHACSVAASGLPDRYWREVLPDRQPTPPCRAS